MSSCELLEEYANTKALRVAQHVRQECADKATTEYIPHSNSYMPGEDVVDRESILSIDIEQFIK